MLLVHPGCSLYAQAWHQEKRPQEGEMALRPVLDFLFPRSRVIQSCPGEGTSASHAESLLVVWTAALLSDLFCESLLNPPEEVKEEDPLAFVHVALAERRPLQCPFAFELVNRGP